MESSDGPVRTHGSRHGCGADDDTLLMEPNE